MKQGFPRNCYDAKMRDVKGSRGSAGDMVTRIHAGQCRFRMPAGDRDFSLLQNNQNDSGFHSSSYSKYNGVLFRGSGGQGVRLTTQLHLVPRLIVTVELYVVDRERFPSLPSNDRTDFNCDVRCTIELGILPYFCVL